MVGARAAEAPTLEELKAEQKLRSEGPTRCGGKFRPGQEWSWRGLNDARQGGCGGRWPFSVALVQPCVGSRPQRWKRPDQKQPQERVPQRSRTAEGKGRISSEQAEETWSSADAPCGEKSCSLRWLFVERRSPSGQWH